MQKEKATYKEKEWTAIINPHAGNSKCKKDWTEIAQLLDKNNITYTPIFTTCQGDAITITKREIAAGKRDFLVIGGDGTLNEVVNGICQEERADMNEFSIGLVPVGTGNDWRRMYNLSNDYKKAIKRVTKDHAIVQDIGLLTYHSYQQVKKERYFLNAAGIGYDAFVCKHVNHLKQRNKGGKLSYWYSLIKGLYEFTSCSAKLSYDEKTVNYDLFSLSVGICQYIGGGMKMIPHANASDGLLSFTAIKALKRLRVVSNIHRLKNGTHIKLPEVEINHTTSIHIETPTPIPVEADGESLGETPCTFSSTDKKLRFII